MTNQNNINGRFIPPENKIQAQVQRRHEIFLQNLNLKIEAHLSNSNLHVKHLERLAGISRTNLHCKLKQATGMSATEYVRRLRLKKAAQLIRDNPQWTIWAVAIEVGFENLGYFTRRFKELYGCTPGIWREFTQLEEI